MDSLSFSRLGTIASVEHSITEKAANASTNASSVVMLASCLALQVARRDDERSEPADERRTS